MRCIGKNSCVGRSNISKMSTMNSIEKNAMQTVIDLISISVRTAPKSAGIDDIICFVPNDKQKKALVKKMIAIGQRSAHAKNNKEIAQAVTVSWVSDARTVERSQGLVLVGVKGRKTFGVNCTCCGFQSCAAFRAQVERNKKSAHSLLGPFCIFKIWDLGIAIASAAKTASMLNVDNRIMYRIGVAAVQTPVIKKHFTKRRSSEHINPILGLPLSASGKNIFFDRFDKMQAASVIKAFHHKRS